MLWYALASYKVENSSRPALVLEGQLFDLHTLCEKITRGPAAARALMGVDLQHIIRNWGETKQAVADLAGSSAEQLAQGGLELARREMKKLCLPFQPTQIFAAASNYIEHANEMGTVLAAKAASKPYMFIKATQQHHWPG